jgi:3-dehydroquinate dehydratase type I
MSRGGVVKIPATVGVIASMDELRAARRMRTPPDLFELRLDYMPALDPEKIAKLRRPIIITARHPAEGGCSRGRRPRPGATREIQRRRDLLLKFLPIARFVDVELRSLRQMHHVWDEATRFHVKRICSVHHLAHTPPHALLQKQFQRAKKAGANIFKIVTRADTRDDLITLLQFLRGARGQSSVMATGKFGHASRLLFPECGSVFVYAPLRHPLYPGQLTLKQLRALQPFQAKPAREDARPPAYPVRKGRNGRASVLASRGSLH